MNPYKAVFRALEKAKINYLIVGGVAVNLYGYSRFTGDIDILLALNRANLKKMAGVMKKMGYIQRLPVDIKDLGNEKKVKAWMKEKELTAYTFISDKKPQLDIDIIVDKSLSFKKFLKNRTVIKIWDIQIPVVSIDDLIIMKKEASRDKDLLDLKALLELKRI